MYTPLVDEWWERHVYLPGGQTAPPELQSYFIPPPSEEESERNENLRMDDEEEREEEDDDEEDDNEEDDSEEDETDDSEASDSQEAESLVSQAGVDVAVATLREAVRQTFADGKLSDMAVLRFSERVRRMDAACVSLGLQLWREHEYLSLDDVAMLLNDTFGR